MNKKNSPNIGHNKKSLLDKTVEHIDITFLMPVKLLTLWAKCHLHLETQLTLAIFNEMLLTKLFNFLTLADQRRLQVV